MRFRDWQSRLEQLIDERQTAPFAWGTNDCAVFACDGVLAVCGYDAAEGLREHRTEAQAAAVLRRHGGLRKLAAKRLGAPIPPLMAQPGDVGLVKATTGNGLALCVGPHWTGPGAAGLTTYPLDAALAAWRCDRG